MHCHHLHSTVLYKQDTRPSLRKARNHLHPGKTSSKKEAATLSGPSLEELAASKTGYGVKLAMSPRVRKQRSQQTQQRCKMNWKVVYFSVTTSLT
jgi:hypothetical protein